MLLNSIKYRVNVVNCYVRFVYTYIIKQIYIIYNKHIIYIINIYNKQILYIMIGVVHWVDVWQFKLVQTSSSWSACDFEGMLRFGACMRSLKSDSFYRVNEILRKVLRVYKRARSSYFSPRNARKPSRTYILVSTVDAFVCRGYALSFLCISFNHASICCMCIYVCVCVCVVCVCMCVCVCALFFIYHSF